MRVHNPQRPVQELGDYITVDLAARLLEMTKGQVDYAIKVYGIQTIKLGNTRVLHKDELKKLAHLQPKLG